MSRVFRATLVAACALLSLSAVAQETPSLGKEVLGNESNPSLSFILDTGGFASLRRGKIATDLSLMDAELAGSAHIDPYFDFFTAFSVSDLDLEEIYATTTALPYNLQLRAGKFLSKVGRQNPTHLHAWRFATQPLATQYLFGDDGLKAAGAELSWLAPTSWNSTVIAAAQKRSKDDGIFYPVRWVNYFDLNDDLGFQFGLNGVFSPTPVTDATGRSTAVGGDLMFRWVPEEGSVPVLAVTWVTEGWYRSMAALGTERWQDAGGYSDLIVTMSRQWEFGLRGDLWRRLGGDAPDAVNGRAPFGVDSQRLTLAATYSPTHFSRVRLQYAVEKMEALPVNQTATLQLEVSAGSHGAHDY